MEKSVGVYNFRKENLPLSPLTGKPAAWYKQGETWTSVFGKLATTMEECRAECVGSYLLTEPTVLRVFGYTESSDITAAESMSRRLESSSDMHKLT